LYLTAICGILKKTLQGKENVHLETISRKIREDEDGATVRHILKAKLHFSSHAISRLTRTPTGILVNGQHARTVDLLHTGDVLTVETGDHRPPRIEATPGNWPLPIVWEDGHLMVVNKPAGMTAHASNFVPDTPTVAGALAYHRGSDFIFHPVSRLDKGTTGLMVIAKSGYVHDLLRRTLHSERFHREYRAVCIGCPSPTRGTVDAPIGRDETSTVRRCVRPDGSPAVSHYEVLSTQNGFSLLKLIPETGRTHQLRVHMASIGHPLAGDWLYGTEDPELITRPALHSCALTLVHPVTEELLTLEAPLPEDMRRLIEE
jgi:RluA family pseudouridine synthase